MKKFDNNYENNRFLSFLKWNIKWNSNSWWTHSLICYDIWDQKKDLWLKIYIFEHTAYEILK